MTPHYNKPRVQKQPPIFICGEGRSGTRLLREILAKHPNIYEVKRETNVFIGSWLIGNSPLLWAELNARRSGKNSNLILAILACMHYRKEIASSYIAKKNYPDDVTKIAKEFSSKSTDRFQLFDELAEFLTKQAGKTRWIEKTPANIYFMDKIAKLYPQAKFIVLYRDPRAVVASWLEKDPYKSLISIVMGWTTITRIIQQGHSNMLAVSFEDLISKPEETIRRICAFIGEDFNPAMLEARMVNRHDETKNQVGFDTSSLNKWQNKLSYNQKILIDSLTKNTRKTFNYLSALEVNNSNLNQARSLIAFIFYFIKELISLPLLKLMKLTRVDLRH